ncbi:hypothetical protein DV096_15045 [Bradymonadaceae bacterium TMQ3]|uniref:DUF2231 domain-containing protein n=1 Tax=Lujinxingia sediminis TaxID=2480984 RepID=A0ABY0CUN9_9DELT|nr:DUF2231 domain-containing protein [Lujinxingia sediminis]RDV37292.1 hypothetical protein DV096_15045 [Bradymonadaceae bacterium TMQ3]RVU46761.1 hypothetical protein EA187_06390 [Lujinxingia sediminis]TXC74771.1 hypothetical protein FRC91_14535 [Bradymonadales bacterium TMQ1]
MGALPDMWRVELWHPLVVHLPIGVLIFGVLAWLAGAMTNPGGPRGFLRPAARLALSVGTAGAWLAVYTGDLADAEVVRTLCDPTVVERHENLAWICAITFTVATVLEFVRGVTGLSRGLRLALRVVIALGLCLGIALLGYVGHLGAKLVYQQGAAVYHPSEMCTEFE